MPDAVGDECQSVQGCVSHSRTPAFQVRKSESGGAFGGLEERGDRQHWTLGDSDCCVGIKKQKDQSRSRRPTGREVTAIIRAGDDGVVATGHRDGEERQKKVDSRDSADGISTCHTHTQHSQATI